MAEGGDSTAGRTNHARWLLLGAGLLLAASAVAQVLQGTMAQGFDAREFYTRAWLEWPTLGVLISTAAAALVGLGASVWSLLAYRAQGAAPRSLAAMPSAGLRDLLVEIGARCLEAVAGPEPDMGLCVDEILRGALLLEASDIHISPSSRDLAITYRVHGALHDVVKLPAGLGPRMAIRVKVLARMDTYARRPLDGRLRHKLGDLPIEARVSSLPADFGERLVLRLVRGSAAVPNVQQLGLDADVEKRLLELLSRPQGLLFVSGPVGSGKTTSLYAALGHIVASRGNVTSLVTLEDPIELQLPFATQTQINTHMGMSFAQTLRSVLRQDPNVLMVGEIRDRETAEIAMQAGLTGHLILTTIHVESAAGTFARMIDMGIDPYTVASATVGSVSQRLVRVLCTHCRKAREPDALALGRFERLGVDLPAVPYYEAVGCEFCEGQGYLGRQPLAEILIMSEKLREAVHDRRPTAEITALARREGMVPLLAAALARAAEGTTSLAEVLRVAG